MQARDLSPSPSPPGAPPAPVGADPRRPGAGSLWPIAAVIAVLAVVTLTRLELFAVYENERDALRLLAQIGQRLERVPGAEQGASLAAVLQPDPKAPASAALLRAAGDAAWLDAGRVLRWHGYLFELEVEARGAAPGAARIKAWPWQHGRTGVAAYAFDTRLGLLGHPNRAGEPGPWSGLDLRPELAAGRGWMRLPKSGLP